MSESLLKLDRPVAVFDIESTGIVPTRDRIVEIAVLKITPDGQSRSTVRRLNPGMPIPPGASAVHGIHDADVADCPMFADIAEKLHLSRRVRSGRVQPLHLRHSHASGRIQAGRHRLFDGRPPGGGCLQHLLPPLPPDPQRRLQVFLRPGPGGAHGAAADTAATWEVIQGELAMHPELPRDYAGLAAYCEENEPDMVDRTRRFRWMGDEVVVNFGKYAGRSLKDIAQNEPGFLRWIMRSDFPEEVQKIASDALMGKYPQKKNGGTGEN